MKTFEASASEVSYTKKEYLNEQVTSSSTATSSLSYSNALQTAQQILLIMLYLIN